MRPKLPLTALIFLALVPASAEAKARPSAAARLTACATSLAEPGRHLVAEGSMRSVSGAARMQMRFNLEVRTPTRPAWTALSAPGFDVWNTADPAARRYTYVKRVEALAAPASYRMVVRFRWLAAAGRTVAVQRRTTRVCEQPDLRPDLVARKLQITPAHGPAKRRYVVTVGNVGSSAAGPFAVTLSVNGALLPNQAVGGLAARGRAKLTFVGPGCAPGSILVVRVDAEGRVQERDEAANQLAVPCGG